MRTALLTTLALVALPLSTSGQAQVHLVGPAANSITVQGEAEIRVVPDEVIITLGVETFDKVLKVSKAANDDRIRRTIAVARDAAVPAEHIQTDYLGVEPRYNRGDIALDLTGYVVRRTIVIRLRDLKKFEDLITGALEAGVTHVHGVEFRTTELRTHRDRARTMALSAAREKAGLLAREAGLKLGRITSIGEASFGYASSYGSGWGGRFSGMSQNTVQSFGGTSLGTDTSLAPGQIAIRASVSASFALD
jgi:uncharacterized protein YggE